MKTCRDARKAVRAAKNAWFQRKALEAEGGKNKGKIVRRCIRDIQRGRRGLVPLRIAAVWDKAGAECDTPEIQQQQQWRRNCCHSEAPE